MQFDVSSNDSMVPPTSQYSYNKLTHTFVSMLSMILDDRSNWYSQNLSTAVRLYIILFDYITLHRCIVGAPNQQVITFNRATIDDNGGVRNCWAHNHKARGNYGERPAAKYVQRLLGHLDGRLYG